jgi:hypothetical protein
VFDAKTQEMNRTILNPKPRINRVSLEWDHKLRNSMKITAPNQIKHFWGWTWGDQKDYTLMIAEKEHSNPSEHLTHLPPPPRSTNELWGCLVCKEGLKINHKEKHRACDRKARTWTKVASLPIHQLIYSPGALVTNPKEWAVDVTEEH